MTMDWREFEQLVAHIERQLSPRGAVVRSPDRIIDKITGRKREVDVSICYQDGDVPILITIECRKRGKTQDDTWIEQLVTKREKIGAHRTIAVSFTDFSTSAIVTAQHYGIEIRRVDEITDDVIASWVSNITIEKISSRYAIVDYTILVEEDEAQFAFVIQEELRRDRFNAKVIFRSENDVGISINDLVKDVYRWEAQGHLRESSDEQDIIRSGADIYGKRITISFASDHFYSLTNKGRANILSVDIELRIKLDRSKVPLSQVYQYSDIEQEITQVAVGRMFLSEHSDNEIKIFVQPSKEDDKIG